MVADVGVEIATSLLWGHSVNSWARLKCVNTLFGRYGQNCRRSAKHRLYTHVEALESRALLAAGDVLMGHGTLGSTGSDINETVLTPANVASTMAASQITTNFGRLFDTTLDGQVYAQPLAVANVNITRGSSLGVHNVLFVATQNDSLYAIDASSGVILWQDSFLQIVDPRVTIIGSPVPTLDVSTIPAGAVGPNGSSENALVSTTDIGPELGILATPAIDPATNILYLDANTQELRNGSTPTNNVAGADWHFVQRLWAVKLSDGSVAISPSNIAVEPFSGGEVIGDTILNPRISGNNPVFTAYNVSVSSLTQSGGVATATINSSTGTGGMRVGDWISISGASVSGYNGSFQIASIPSTTTLKFNVSSSLPSSAGGSVRLIGAADYKYVAGPYVKGTGNNSDTFNGLGKVATTSNADSWQTNLADSTSVFAGTTPSAAGDIAFNALLQMNRVATTLINGEIYLGFDSHGDEGPYYGWILGYNAATLANNAAFVSVPSFDNFANSSGEEPSFIAQAGFWNAGSTIATDGTYLYVFAGNGVFNPTAANFNSTYTSTDNGHVVQMPLDDDYGDSLLKLQFDPNTTQNNVSLATGIIHSPNGTYNPDGGYNADGYGLKVIDYFTPSNVFELNKNDEDIGTGGVMLIPSIGAGSTTAPNGDPLLVTAGKEGRIYLIDANNLGGYNTQYVVDGNESTNADPAPYDRVLGEYYYFEANGNPGTLANNQTDKGYDTPSYFDGQFYVGLGAGSVGTLQSPQQGFIAADFFFTSTPHTGIQPTPIFTSANDFGGRGTTASISSNGLANGIIWNTVVQQSGSDALVAYDVSATGIVSEMFNSNWTIVQQGSNITDTLTGGVDNATGVKSSIPTVFNGMVYVGTGGGSGITGHMQGTITGYGLLNPVLHQSTNLTGTANGSTVHLTWTRNSNDTESETQIERSSDGVTWTALAVLPNAATSYTDTSVTSGTQYHYRVTEIYGIDSSTVSDAVTVTVTVGTYPKGDFNLDHSVNASDLVAGMQALIGLATYQTNNHLSNADLEYLGDVNGDGKVNNIDIQALINLLISGGGSESGDSAGKGSGGLTSASIPTERINPVPQPVSLIASPVGTTTSSRNGAINSQPMESTSFLEVTNSFVDQSTIFPSISPSVVLKASNDSTTAKAGVRLTSAGPLNGNSIAAQSNTPANDSDFALQYDQVPSGVYFPEFSESANVPYSTVQKTPALVDQFLSDWSTRRVRRPNLNAIAVSKSSELETLDDMFLDLDCCSPAGNR
ncbi:MAG TPA: dockerin type I domain-containing protein [Pirellulales bacterium]|jgi:hypothetical protein|nr:dockerin type I domain-containing protein [Pirellulales bacterium]